ncbi:MAG: DNA polymerase IV [Candidatus Bathyarchaeia archaeon]
MAPRVIIHTDLDCFYAQCEENINPGIRGKPVVVCVYSGRTPDSGVVSTSNYQARKYGVKAGIPITRAKKLLESTDAVFLPINRTLYESVSNRIMDFLKSQADIFEKVGIDEAYLDVSATSSGKVENAKFIATIIKQLIFRQEHMTCSIGIGPNKLVAKIASAHVKPDGLTVVEPEHVQNFLRDQPISVIPGVGTKVEEKLSQIKVRTINELVNLDPILLQEKFGKSLGSYLFQAARGKDDEEVRDREVPTQFSRIGTLKENTRNFQLISPLLTDLANSVCEKLRENNMTCKSVSIVAILDNLSIHTRSTTLESATDTSQSIIESSAQLMAQYLDSTPDATIRRIGVRVSGLSKESDSQTKIESYL